jgi:hypothetical protein
MIPLFFECRSASTTSNTKRLIDFGNIILVFSKLYFLTKKKFVHCLSFLRYLRYGTLCVSSNPEKIVTIPVTYTGTLYSIIGWRVTHRWEKI